MNTVGTFGVASASYYWSQIAGALGRLAPYLAGDSATTWHMLVQDYWSAIMSFFVLSAVLGVPLSWHMTVGGDVLAWVWFKLVLKAQNIGISQRRAEWFVRWTAEVASAPTVHMKNFEVGFGRIMFVAGASEHEWPFPGPLCITLHPRTAARRVPAYVAFIMHVLSQSIAKHPHHECGTHVRAATIIPRVDGQASS